MTHDEAKAEARRRWGRDGWAWNTSALVRIVGTRTRNAKWRGDAFSFGRGYDYKARGIGTDWSEAFAYYDATNEAHDRWGDRAFISQQGPGRFIVGWYPVDPVSQSNGGEGWIIEGAGESYAAAFADADRRGRGRLAAPVDAMGVGE